MSSLSPPTTFPHYSSNLSSWPLSLQKSPFLISKKLNRAYKASCRATYNTKNGETSLVKFDRRIVLLGVGALYMATNIASDPLALAANDVFPKTLNEVVKITVKRPKKSRSLMEKEEEEEILVIDGIEMEKDVFVKFDVYLDEKDEAASGPENSEFAGSFANVPQKGKDGKKIKTCLRLGISELLEDLGAEGDESVLVSLVPKAGSGLVSIGGVKIELAS